MKKLIISLFISFILFSCGNNEVKQNEINNDNKPTIVVDNNNLKNQKEKIQKLNKDEVELNNKANKITSKAIENLNVKFCNNIGKSEFKKSCYSSVLDTKIRFGIINKTFCKNFYLYKSLKNKCLNNYYSNYAKENNDLDSCLKISDNTNKGFCISSIKDEIIKNAKNDSICSKFQDELSKNDCINTINKKIAYKKKDISYCKKLIGDLNKNDCINTINKKITSNSMVVKSCNKFTDQIHKNECKKDIILRNADAGINKCLLSNDSILKNECLIRYSITKGIKEKTIKYCETNLKDNIQKNECINKIITKLNKENHTTNYCKLYETKLKEEECKSKNNINNNLVIESNVSAKNFCDNLMTNKDGTLVDKNLCYKLTGIVK